MSILEYHRQLSLFSLKMQACFLGISSLVRVRQCTWRWQSLHYPTFQHPRSLLIFMTHLWRSACDVISQARPSHFSRATLKSWEWPGDTHIFYIRSMQHWWILPCHPWSLCMCSIWHLISNILYVELYHFPIYLLDAGCRFYHHRNSPTYHGYFSKLVSHFALAWWAPSSGRWSTYLKMYCSVLVLMFLIQLLTSVAHNTMI